MLFSEKLLYAFAVLCKSATSQQNLSFWKKMENSTFLFEIYLSFMGAVLASTKKFCIWELPERAPFP